MSEVYHACLYTAQGEVQCTYKTKIELEVAKPKPELYLSKCATKMPNLVDDPARHPRVKILDSELLQNW